MLKNCFECLVGTNNNPVEHDTYGTRLNGHTQTTMWSTGENEDIFQLPRPLKSNNIISITFNDGNFPENREKLLFKLKSGIPQRSNQVLQIEIDFIKDTITITTHNSGPANPNSLKPSHIFNSPEFSLTLQVSENSNGFEDTLQMNINMGIHAVDTVEVDRNMLENSTFFTLDYGSIEVKDLKLAFTYA